MRRLATALLLLVLALSSVSGEEKAFVSLSVNSGLSDNNVLQMLQLHDGRILAYTQRGINIYDGTQFSFIPRNDSCSLPLRAYKGQTHIYADTAGRLWIKEWGRVSVVDLSTDSCIAHPRRLLSDMGISGEVLDLFADSSHRLWLVTGKGIVAAPAKRLFALDKRLGDVQDIEVLGDRLYVFHHSGTVACYDTRTARPLYTSLAYDTLTARRYASTSLVAPGRDGCLYQIRTGGGGKSIFLRFNTRSRQWTTIYTSDYLLHTLIVTPGNSAYISTADGYFRFDLATLSAVHFSALRLPDGSLLHTGLNTVCLDREGGVWLGTYDKGILYASPLSGIFDTRQIRVPVTPVLINFFLGGRRMRAGATYGGRVVTPVEAPWIRQLTLSHDENALAFRFSAMCYARPHDTHYRFRLGNGEWTEASAESTEGYVDSRGTLYLSFVGLPPGDYRLQVMASSDGRNWQGGVYTLPFTILPPWWATWWARLLYVLVAMAIVAAALLAYTHSVKRRMERKSHEEMLMMRIRDLLDKTNRLEEGYGVVLSDTGTADGGRQEAQQMSRQDMDFMQRATSLVEKNIGNGQYNVETLSRDLCMERTGLYRKLTALLDQSPVAFIRTIRLKRAAEMLREGSRSVTEISELTGFSSPSYFSKCFYREYGCKPSEYR